MASSSSLFRAAGRNLEADELQKLAQQLNLENNSSALVGHPPSNLAVPTLGGMEEKFGALQTRGGKADGLNGHELEELEDRQRRQHFARVSFGATQEMPPPQQLEQFEKQQPGGSRVSLSTSGSEKDLAVIVKRDQQQHPRQQQQQHNPGLIGSSLQAGNGSARPRDDMEVKACASCLNPLRSPRMLHCLHFFCLECMKRLTAAAGPCISCPVCQFITDPGPDGIEDFQTNESVTKILDILNGSPGTCDNCTVRQPSVFCEQCDASLCTSCNEELHGFRSSAKRPHAIMPISKEERIRKAPKCSRHPGEKLLFLSVTRQQLICRDCILVGGHAGDRYVTVEDAGKQTRLDLAELLQRARDAERRVTEELVAAQRLVPQAVEKYEASVARLNARAEELTQALKKRHTDALEKGGKVRDRKVEALLRQGVRIGGVASALEECVGFGRTVVESASDFEILRLHRAMAGLVRAATKVSVNLEPCESPTITEEDIFPPPPPAAAPSPAPTPPISRASTAAGHRDSSGQGVAAAAAAAALITPPVVLPAATSFTPSAALQDSVGGGAGGSIYALGGWDGGSNSASVEVYDVNTHHWVPSRSMNTRRRGLAAASSDGCIYVVGGFDGGQYLATMEVYDPGLEIWRQGPSMSTPRCFAGAAFVGGKLHVVGGYFENKNLASGEVFDPQTGKWSPMPPMATPRRGLCVASFCGRLFAGGGWDGAQNLQTTEFFDVKTQAWHPGPNMLVPRCSAACAVSGARLIVCGGWDGSACLKSVEVLDAAGGGWMHAQSMLSPRSYGTAVPLLNFCVVLGGWDGVGSARLKSGECIEVEALPSSRGKGGSGGWTGLPHMTSARYGCAAAVV